MRVTQMAKHEGNKIFLALVRPFLLTSTLIYLNLLIPPYQSALVIDASQQAAALQQINSINNDSNYNNENQIFTAISKSPLDQAKNVKQSSGYAAREYKRPIWNIAHMVNSIKELDYRLSKGANAVEADVTFNALGQPTFIYHGPPCDCWRHCYQQEDFDDYLAYVHEIALAEPTGIGRNLSLLFLDLKLDHLDDRAKERAGRELADSVMANLYPRHSQLLAAIDRYSGPTLRLIISINHVADAGLVKNFMHQLDTHNSSDLMHRIGFDVGMNDDISQIESMWQRFGANNLRIPLNLWQGDGYTNCISPFYNLERLSIAISKRDNELGYPRKVYQWTIDLHDRIREAFLMGVDAIMTNHPERVLAVLGEAEIGHNFRIATRDDNPFKKIPTKSIHRGNGGARYPRTISPVSGGFLGSLMDVLNSWLSYVREIPYLSLPTTTRIFTKVKRQFKFQSSSDNIESRLSTLFPNYNYTTIGTSQTISRSFEGQQMHPAILRRSTIGQYRSSPEQLIDKTTTPTTTTPTSAIITEFSTTTSSIPTTMISTTINDTQAKETSESQGNTTIAIPIEPPKWYTSMASNFLVSMLKLALPVNSTTSTTTSVPPTTTE